MFPQVTYASPPSCKYHILFAGLQSNVADWYQLMDLFVMPSRFEGLPVVGIEAQAAGLGCVFSDAVPEEVLLSPHAIQIRGRSGRRQARWRWG